MNVFSNISINVDVEDTVKISPNEKQNTIEYGDAIFTGSSETPDECGMSSVLTTRTNKKLYLNSFCFGYRLNSIDTFNPNFLKHLLRSKPIRNQIAKTANGVTRFNVSKKGLPILLSPFPHLNCRKRLLLFLTGLRLWSMTSQMVCQPK